MPEEKKFFCLHFLSFSRQHTRARQGCLIIESMYGGLENAPLVGDGARKAGGSVNEPAAASIHNVVWLHEYFGTRTRAARVVALVLTVLFVFGVVECYILGRLRFSSVDDVVAGVSYAGQQLHTRGRPVPSVCWCGSQRFAWHCHTPAAARTRMRRLWKSWCSCLIFRPEDQEPRTAQQLLMKDPIGDEVAVGIAVTILHFLVPLLPPGTQNFALRHALVPDWFFTRSLKVPSSLFLFSALFTTVFTFYVFFFAWAYWIIVPLIPTAAAPWSLSALATIRSLPTSGCTLSTALSSCSFSSCGSCALSGTTPTRCALFKTPSGSRPSTRPTSAPRPHSGSCATFGPAVAN